MELKSLGHSTVVEGQLITLVVENPSVPMENLYVMLYVKKDFNISDEMAQFYESNKDDESNTKFSEVMVGEFYQYLLRKGLVDRPRSDVVRFGVVGRPSKRILDEYKYRLSPEEFVLTGIRERLELKSNYIVTDAGYRVLVASVEDRPENVAVTLELRGTVIGSLRFFILHGSTEVISMSPADMDRLTAAIAEIIKDSCDIPEVRVHRVFIDCPLFNVIEETAHEHGTSGSDCSGGQ